MTLKSLYIFTFIVVLLAIGTGIRLTGLKHVDLYCDEAFHTEISESLIKYGELNNFRYSEFYPEHFFRSGTVVIIPTLYHFIQAPFMLLKGVWDPNIVPRLPGLFSSILLIGLLYFVSKEFFSSKIAGLIMIMLAIFNTYHIGLSRTALAYSVLPLFLCLVVWFLIHALKRNDKRYWIMTSIFLVLSFYVHQQALFFGFIYLASLIICFKKSKKKHALNLTICFFAAFSISLVWILFFGKMLIFHQVLFTDTNQAIFRVGKDYNFSSQLSRITLFYHSMLPVLILKMAFFIGFAKTMYEIVRQKGYIKILLVVWSLLPFTFMLSRAMSIHYYHFNLAWPPVMIITAYGIYVFTRYALDKVHPRYLHLSRHAYFAIIILFSIAISLYQLKQLRPYWSPGISTDEFGSPNIVSRACDYIKRHYDNEVIIAPMGLSESYYLDKYVYDKEKPDAVDRNIRLILESSAWVFMGDRIYNRYYGDTLDEFERYVQKYGKLIMHSKPISRFASTENISGYALYYIKKQNSIPGFD